MTTAHFDAVLEQSRLREAAESDRQVFLDKVRAGRYSTARIVGRDPHDAAAYCRILWTEVVPDAVRQGQHIAVFGVRTNAGHHAIFTEESLADFTL